MGEIAEMMIDGILCEQCGVFIDEHPNGIPRLCEDCQREQFEAGGFVRYIMKNELGLIKRCDDTGCFVWYHTGGTAAKTHYRDMELTDVSSNEYSNEYAVPSLFERYIRQQADKDVSDLIDSDDISDETKEYMEIRNENIKGAKENEI